jgi:AcrR family transcriptional regulator
MPRAKTTPKSEQTRMLIFDTAKRLFRDQGFDATTLRRIAEEADVALGLSYRYFPSKEDLALALYLELADNLEAATRRMKPQPLVDAFGAALSKKLRLLAPQRDALAALFAASLTRGRDPSAVSVVGERAAPVRERVRAVFERVVAQANDLPPLDDTERQALVSVLYGVHLLVVLAWLVSGRETGARFVAASNEMLARALPFLALPPARKALVQLARSFDSFLEGSS